MVAHQVAYDGFLDRHRELIRRVYREHRDLMLAAMEKEFPKSVHWTHPQGGLFLWVTLPEGNDATQLLPLAVEQKVAFVPGSPFFPNGGGENTLRMNFSNATPDGIRDGIDRLGSVFKRHLRS